MTSSSTSLLKRLWREHTSRYFLKITFAAICMGLVAATTAANAWLMQPVLDDVFVNKNISMLTVIPAAVLALAIIKGFSTYAQSVIMKNLGQRIVCDMQTRLYSHLLHSDLALFHDQSTGRLVSRFTNDINLMRTSVSTAFTAIVRESLTTIALVGVMFYQSWQLALIAFAAFPLAVRPVLKLARRMRKISGQTQEELGNLTARLDETFTGIRIIKAYGREDYESSRAREIIGKLYKLYSKASRVQSAASPLLETLGGVAVAAVIWYGGMQVIEGTTTPGAFFSFVTAMIMAYKPAKTLSSLGSSLQEGLAAADRLFSVLDQKPQIADKAEFQDIGKARGDVALHSVSFSYSPERIILNNISLEIPAGSRVALVGPSGSGKSTIINLLLRFYDANSGVITVDGHDITGISLASLRRNMSLVTQETILFDDSIRANICYGLDDVSEQEMLEAAKSASAHDFITQLPNGYDTIVGQNGVRLSGGQRQRIAIARAMIKNAPILLLDEATSSLDPVSEKQVQDALEALMTGKTTIMIAHRLSTVIKADCIYVIAGGEVSEQGTHESLIAQGGHYASLYAGEPQINR